MECDTRFVARTRCINATNSDKAENYREAVVNVVRLEEGSGVSIYAWDAL